MLPGLYMPRGGFKTKPEFLLFITQKKYKMKPQYKFTYIVTRKFPENAPNNWGTMGRLTIHTDAIDAYEKKTGRLPEMPTYSEWREYAEKKGMSIGMWCHSAAKFQIARIHKYQDGRRFSYAALFDGTGNYDSIITAAHVICEYLDALLD